VHTKKQKTKTKTKQDKTGIFQKRILRVESMRKIKEDNLALFEKSKPELSGGSSARIVVGCLVL
jgi:hypothetical protein